jgi:hypothetical protein
MKLNAHKINVEVKKEVKKAVGQIKTAQSKFQDLLKDRTWVDDAKKYAESQGKEVRKLLKGDISKVKKFIKSETKNLENFQKKIPGEIKKIKSFVEGQRKEFDKLLKKVTKASIKATRSKPKSKS